MFSNHLLLLLIGISSLSYINASELRKPRILNGEVSKDGAYPYHVSVLRIVQGSPEFKCGGAIIHRRYVLTAAHCVNKYKSSDLIIRSGGPLGAPVEKPQNERRSFHRVVKTFLPKIYSDLTCRRHQHDIAILKVRESFDLSNDERYKKVYLPEIDNDYEDLSATVTGYGPDYVSNTNVLTIVPERGNQALQYPTELRSMPVTVVSNEQCQNNISVILTQGTLCAKSINLESQTCFNDDGGPLVRDGVVIGISNDRKCNPSEPEIFTRVSSYLSFISNVLQHHSSADILIQ